MEHQVREHNSLALSRQHSAPACRTAIGGVEQFAILERFPSTGDELQQSIRTTKRNAKAEKKPKTSSLRYLPHIPNGKHLNRARFWEIKKKIRNCSCNCSHLNLASGKLIWLQCVYTVILDFVASKSVRTSLVRQRRAWQSLAKQRRTQSRTHLTGSVGGFTVLLFLKRFQL